MAGKDRDKKGVEVPAEKQDFTRRDFLKRSRDVAVGLGVAAVLPHVIWLDDAVAAIPASGGYLLVDTKKCQGCISCMLACSLVHEGVENPSLARIQVIQNSFEKFPNDLTLVQCRQCVEPPCVEACPTGALHVESKHGNVRMIDAEKCIGCQSCINACPFTPSRSVWNSEKVRTIKCDLCSDAPYHWDENGGGPSGKQACVEVCPVGAIKFTKKIPAQEGDDGYNVNLRDRSWRRLGYPSD